MARTPPVRGELLSDHSGLYDGPSLSDDDLTGDALPADPSDRDVIKAAAVARILRAAIFAGEYEAGSKFPSRKELARDHNSTEGTMNRALQMLAREGLLKMGSGRDTTVEPLGDFQVLVTAPGPHAPGPDDEPGNRHLDTVLDAMSAAEDGDPAVTDLDMCINGHAWEWSMIVRSVGAAHAAVIGMRMARKSAVGAEWVWPKASVSAEPA